MQGPLDVPNVSRETEEKLATYLTLLKKWTRKINLVAPDTIPTASSRHFADSLQLLSLIPQPPKVWVDIGSGGGFPGLVLAIAAKDMGWDTQFTLIESDQRKAVFLQTVSRETEVSVNVIAKRVESVDPMNAEIVSARALAPLPKLIPWIRRHIGVNGVAILPKGRNYQQELQEARDNFDFSLVIHPSGTDSEAVILEIGDIKDV